jgi:hypothetical protein
MGYKHKGFFSDKHRERISEALRAKGIVPPSRKGKYKNGKPFDRKVYMKKYNAKSYAKNPEFHKQRTKVRNRNKLYQTNRMKTDINFHLSSLFRKRICRAIKVKSGIKAYKSIELLGCSINEARKYLELQFRNGMSWDNYAKFWEIDHRLPLVSFDLTKPEEQKKAFHFTNLQPLTVLENRNKGVKIMI